MLHQNQKYYGFFVDQTRFNGNFLGFFKVAGWVDHFQLANGQHNLIVRFCSLHWNPDRPRMPKKNKLFWLFIGLWFGSSPNQPSWLPHQLLYRIISFVRGFQCQFPLLYGSSRSSIFDHWLGLLVVKKNLLLSITVDTISSSETLIDSCCFAEYFQKTKLCFLPLRSPDRLKSPEVWKIMKVADFQSQFSTRQSS